MRLLSYNIHKGIGGRDRRYRMERILQVIEEENPDLICLQEVDHNTRRSRYDDQPKMLARYFHFEEALFQMNCPRKRGGYGNLILSRWPLQRHHHVSLRLKKRKPRGAQLVVVATPEGPLQVVNWHLGLAEKERRWQVDHLLNHVLFRESAHLPTLICGDFNDWRNKLSGAAFSRHRFRQATSPPSHYRSFPAFLAVTALDKAFYRGDLAVRHARIIRTPLAKRASDHLPLVVDFHLTGNGEHFS
jgi:endonuclease/exonuclease/phosphatase family metal-dependent hydrolase